MYRRVAQRLTLRTAIALTISTALLPAPGISFLISGAAQGQREERKGKPKPGKPEGVWPDLEKAKQQSPIERECATADSLDDSFKEEFRQALGWTTCRRCQTEPSAVAPGQT